MAQEQPPVITLRELNGRVKKLLLNPAVQNCWVRADLSDVAVKGGHCYCELVEKDEKSGVTVAKMRGIIWRSVLPEIRAKFMAVTGQDLHSGMKVLLRVSVNYHEQYGISLIITDIDPSYTIGDMERIRREILDRLKREGIYDANRELAFPDVPQRIAVVSAQGAAGYGDFINQLQNNQYGLKFYTCLFPAVMQGQNTVPTMKAALQRVKTHQRLFDCAVIIRGGGSTSDLNSFDNYELAAAVATFPLPVVVGIGHERDVTALDYIAAKRVKTPTAAAEWLIGRGAEALARMEEIRGEIARAASDSLAAARQQLQYISSTIPLLASSKVESAGLRLNNMTRLIPATAQSRVAAARLALGHTLQTIATATKTVIDREKSRLTATADKVEILSPQSTLKRGYSLTKVNGRALTAASAVKSGDEIVTCLSDGTITSTVK